MSKVKLNLIAAASENMGIGINGNLPWRLKKEMAYFTKMTTSVKDNKKINAIIMGRRTWDSVPAKFFPFKGRVNIILTHHVKTVKEKVPEEVIVLPGLDEAVAYIENRNDIESSWVIGGSSIYKLAMKHASCDKIYLTEIQKKFECDTFFPSIDRLKFEQVSEDGVPSDLQTEQDTEYYFRIYKKI